MFFWLPPEREPNVTKYEDKGEQVSPAFGGLRSQLFPLALGHSFVLTRELGEAAALAQCQSGTGQGKAMNSFLLSPEDRMCCAAHHLQKYLSCALSFGGLKPP